MSPIRARKFSRRPLSSFLFSAVLFSWIVAAPFGQILAHAASDKDPVVSISAGQIRGALRPDGGAEFLGIPYAQPPAADLRWHEPLPVTPWTGLREAKEFGAPCAQPVLGDWNKHDAETSNEDCLFLNVITAEWPVRKPMPVMFWLHGGANTGGTASSALYKDGTLVRHGIMLVTVNYRLGMFGFFAHPGLTAESPHHVSGNYGLLDQIAALQWVHDNVAKFGGDSQNITVFGQSAGAQDTGFLMTSPLSQHLFQRAIAESGTPFGPPPASLAEAQQTAVKIAETLKAPDGPPALKYLRGLSTAEILKGISAQGRNAPPLGPIIDGWVLPRFAAEVFAFGKETSIPMITGNTAREFSMPPDEVRSMIQGVAGDLAPQALRLYRLADGAEGDTDPLYGPAANQWLADFIFRCPSTTAAMWHNAARNPTYEYQFEHAIPGQEAQGAVHSSDLPYVFGFYPKTGNIAGAFTDADFKLADLIESYWTNFAKTGNPNGENLPHWPEFGDSQSYIEFTQDVKVVAKSGGLRRPQCDLYREVLKQRMK